ncbi:MAG: AMP-binding protein [Nocardioides sp.]
MSRTLPEALAEVVAQIGEHAAYSDKVGIEGAGWRTLTWSQLREQALDLAAGLVDIGVQPGDRVAIMARNRNEHVVADLAAVHAGAVSISIYLTFSPDQLGAVAAHAEPTVAIVEGSRELALWAEAGALGVGSSVRHVVMMDPGTDTSAWSFERLGEVGRAARATDPEPLQARIDSIGMDDPATILYTSGSTGAPKGVLVSHANVWFAAVGKGDPTINPGPPTIAYLPYAHITERVLGMYIPQTTGWQPHQVGPEEVYDALLEVRPLLFFGVPRVWEKLAARIEGALAAYPPEQRPDVEAALAAGEAYVAGQQTGHTMTPEIKAAFAAADAAHLKALRATVGLDNVIWAAAGGAPLPVPVSTFLARLGIALYNIYGMTETTASISSSGAGDFRIGSVGRPPDGNEVRIGADGEILVRGPAVTAGYFRAAEASDHLFDEDGWLRTGDIGYVDDDGFLFVTDRKKELIITSVGKNIAPSNVESLLKRNPLISQALVYGEGRPYLVALLTLDPRVAAALTDDEVEAAVADAVAEANRRLSRPEQVKRYAVLPDEWRPETDELTATLKLRRRVIHAKFAPHLSTLYE